MEIVGSDYTHFVDSTEAIDKQYPEDVNSKLWKDIKARKYEYKRSKSTKNFIH